MPLLTEEDFRRIDEIVERGLTPPLPPSPTQRGIFGLVGNVASLAFQNFGSAVALAEGALGIVPAGSVAEQIAKGPARAAFIRPGGSIEAFFGFDPKLSGLARDIFGRSFPIELAPERSVTGAFRAIEESFGGVGTIEQAEKQAPFLVPAAFFTADIAQDPLNLIPGVAGARTLTAARGLRGFIPFSRTRAVSGVLERLGIRAGGIEGAAVRLQRAGASESQVRNYIRASLPPERSFIRQFVTGDDPREFFTRGRLFGRNLDPALSVFGRPVPTTAGRLAGEKLRAFDALQESSARIAAEGAAETVATKPLSTAGIREVPVVAPEAEAAVGVATRQVAPTVPEVPTAPVPPFDAVIRQSRAQGFVPGTGVIRRLTGIGPREAVRVQRQASEFLAQEFARLAPPKATSFEKLLQASRQAGKVPSKTQVRVVTGATGGAARSVRQQIRGFLEAEAARPPRFAVRARPPVGGQIAAVNLRRAAPGATIQRLSPTSNEFLVTLPNNKSIRVDTAAVIDQPTGVVARLGRPLKEGEVVAGRTVIATPEGRKLMGSDAFVQIRPGEGPEVFSDEFFHVADEWDLFSGAERASLQRRFAKGVTDADEITERIAEGVGRWMGQRSRNAAPANGLLERIYQVFLGLFEDIFGPTAGGTLRRFERGEIFRRPAALQPGATQQVERFAVQAERATDPASLMAEHVQRGDDFTTQGGRLATAVAGVRGTLGKIIAEPSKTLQIIEQTPFAKGIRRKMFNKTLDAMDAMNDTNERAISAGLREEQGFASNPEYLSNNLPGLIQREAELLGQSQTAAAHGIPNPAADAARFAATGSAEFRPWLFRGSWEKKMHVPLREHLIATTGEARAADLANLREQAGHLAVSERAIGESQEVLAATEQAREGLVAMRAGPDVPLLPAPQKLLNTNLMTGEEWRVWSREGGDVDQIVDILQERVKNWTDNFTGVGRSTDQSDLAVHQAFIEQMRSEGKLEALQKTIEINRNFHLAKLEYGFRKGLISEPVYTSLLQKEAYFTGLQRVLDEGVGGGGGNILHLFHGSGREIRNPVTTTAENVIEWIQRADRNEVLQEWAGMLGDLDGVGADISHIARRATLEEFNAQKAVEIGQQQTKAIKKMIVQGEPQYWAFTDHQVALAMDKIGRRAMRGPLMSYLAIPARVLRWSVTRSPYFAARNVLRDNFQRVVVSQHGGRPWDVMKRATPDEVSDLIHRGASFSGWDFKDFGNDFAKVQARFTRRISTDRNTIISSVESLQDGGAAIMEKIEALPAFSERVGRLAEYRNALADVRKRFPGIGQADAEIYAARHARGLLDFAVAGDWGEHISMVTAFFNPAIQGSRVMFEALRRNPRRFAATTLAFISAADLASYAWNKGVGAQKEWENLPSYRKDFYWNLKVGPFWVTVPKPFEVGVFGSLPARTVNFADGNSDAFKGYVKSVFTGLTPVDESLLAGPFRPFLEAIANRDFFRGYYIVPPHEEGLALDLRRGAKRASRISKGISSLLKDLYEVDPRILDQLLRSQTGDIGRLVLDVSSVAQPGQPRRGVFRTLVAQGGFIREPSTFSAEVVEEAIEFDRRFRLTGTRGARRLRELASQAADAPTVTQKSALVQRLLSAAGQRRLQQSQMNTRELIRRQLQR